MDGDAMKDSVRDSEEFEEFINDLYACGWAAPNDAQWTEIIPVFLRYKAGRDALIGFARCDEKLKMIAAVVGNHDPAGTYVQSKIIRAILGDYAQPLISEEVHPLLKRDLKEILHGDP